MDDLADWGSPVHITSDLLAEGALGVYRAETGVMALSPRAIAWALMGRPHAVYHELVHAENLGGDPAKPLQGLQYGTDPRIAEYYRSPDDSSAPFRAPISTFGSGRERWPWATLSMKSIVTSASVRNAWTSSTL